MREQLRKDLLNSNYIHSPLPIYEEETREARCEKKPVLSSVLLDDMTSLEHWEAIGPYAKMELSKEHTRQCENSLKFTAPTKLDHWPNAYGRIYTIPSVMRRVNHENWEHINRISFWVYPDMPGFRSICLRMQFHNEGEHPVPDRYDREGHHNVNLVDRKWQKVSVEIPYLHRDDVTGLSFDYDMVGREVVAAEIACWYITDITLETLDEKDLDVYEGWQVGEHRIAFSGSGYQVGSRKIAVVNEPGTSLFKVVETGTGKTVLEKEIETTVNGNGTFQVLDFSEVMEPGEYLIVCGGIVSRSFPIGDDVWEDSVWKVLNFLFCERCGYEVPGKHLACHRDNLVKHGDKAIIGNGGWHDAGDMSQNLTSTGECTYALFELLDRVRHNKPLYDRVLEEAKWGLDWVLKTRFGDGYRVTFTSKSCWSNGIIGDDDDIIREAANQPIENFIAAGAEALAYKRLKDSDPVLANYALKCAKEDWNFGYIDRDRNGRAPLDDGNRIYTDLLMYSCATWSALDLYDATGDSLYKESAVEFAHEIMGAQQQEIPDWDVPFVGFFYDNKDRKLIAHCSHRCHDHEWIMALKRLCEHFPEHEDYAKWMYAITLYGDYAKKAYSYTAPYYNAPASIYHEDEAFHREEYDMGMIDRFLVDDERKENYKKQVQSGIPLGKGYYLRRFPVAFAHRGQHTVTLCGGKAMANVAFATKDYDAAELAQRQFEWIVGKNPFAESVMFGEGYDYCQEYAVLPGEMVGELGVGFACLDEHDSAFWPQVNTCVYKEVWINPPLRWAWLAADLNGGAKVKAVLKPNAGDVVFTNTLSGKEYRFTPCTETGLLHCGLPSGNYVVEYDGRRKHMALLAAQSYTLTAPLADYAVESRKDGNQVTITLNTSGEGPVTLEYKAENLKLTGPSSVTLGESVTFTAEIVDPKKPYLAIIVPNGDIEERLSVYGW